MNFVKNSTIGCSLITDVTVFYEIHEFFVKNSNIGDKRTTDGGIFVEIGVFIAYCRLLNITTYDVTAKLVRYQRIHCLSSV